MQKNATKACHTAGLLMAQAIGTAAVLVYVVAARYQLPHPLPLLMALVVGLAAFGIMARLLPRLLPLWLRRFMRRVSMTGAHIAPAE